MAEKSGITLRMYHRYERGISEPTPSMIGRFCDALGCEPQDFFSTLEASAHEQFGASIRDIIGLLDAWEKAPQSARAKAMRSLTSQDQRQTTEELLRELEAAGEELASAQPRSRAKSE